VKELDAGSWMMFEQARFSTAVAGPEQSSQDALCSAIATLYYRDGDSL
jgi:hypothetical protein